MEKSENFDRNSGGNSKTTIGILSALLGVAVIAAVFFGIKSSNFQSTSETLQSDLNALNETHTTLQGELDTLETDYQSQIEENNTLIATLEERKVEVEQLQARVQRARAQLSESQSMNEKINERLVQLESLKDSLESDIASLQMENQELLATNEAISLDLEMSKMQINDLNDRITVLNNKNEALTSRLFQIAPAGFVADNFAIKAVRKNQKLTSKASQTNEILVRFDLRDVPKEYQTDEELYLVVTEFDGNPIDYITGKTVQIKSAEPMEVKAADVERIKLGDLQNVEMSFTPEKNLESGLYNVLVYADHGFLGSTSFELR